MCFNDAGGWSCTGNVANSLNLTQPIGDCVMQVELSNSNSNNIGTTQSEITQITTKTTVHTSGTNKVTIVITEDFTPSLTSNKSPSSPTSSENSSSGSNDEKGKGFPE
jgi:hypothetical protein